MFSSLTSYLFGAASEPTAEAETGAPSDAKDSNHELRIRATENEWVLVEKSRSSRMETSSMENLLIEHPSMSVYSHRGRQSSEGDESDASSDIDTPAPAVTQTTVSRTKRHGAGLARHEPSRRSGNLSTKADLVKAQTVKAMQRSQQRRVHKDLSRSRVLRNNKVRDVQSANRRGIRHQVLNQPRAQRSSQY